MAVKPPFHKEDTEENVSTDSSGVKVPEEFQVKVAELLKGATKEMIDYVQDSCYDNLDELDKVKRKAEFSTEDMPKNN